MMLRFAPLILLLAACAPDPKTYQEACFEPASPVVTEAQKLQGVREVPEFDPVLTVRSNDGVTLVYCD